MKKLYAGLAGLNFLSDLLDILANGYERYTQVQLWSEVLIVA